jgi:hypothetical protein
VTEPVGFHRFAYGRSPVRAVLSVAAVAMAAAGQFVLGGTAFAATTTTSVVKVAASDDAYVSTARPTYTFGANQSLIAGTAGGDRMLSYLKFTVGALPAGAKLSKVELSLTREDAKAVPALKLKQVAGTSWSQASLSYRTAPATGVELATGVASATTVGFDLTGTITAPGTYAFAVTSTSSTAIARLRASETGAPGPALNLTLTRTESTPTPTPTPGQCTVDAKLVPSCNVLWGAAAGGFSSTPRDQALRTWEATSGRTAGIYHTYHRGDELFPTAAEIAMAHETGKPRLLMTNWKVGYGSTWANVAAGGQDGRIDRLASYLKATFTDKFFMVLHHEPENDVNTAAGSGMTPADYVAMYRHTVARLKADGVSNAVFVMAYMGNEKWTNMSWWYDLYPGDDVVDWIGTDSYLNAQPGGYHNGDFTNLMNRTTDAKKFPGFYTWATTKHPGKPIMAAEWGVYDSSSTADPANTAKIFDTVLPQLKTMPAIKALVYFDTASDQGGRDMRIDSSPAALTSFKKIANDPVFTVKLG